MNAISDQLSSIFNNSDVENLFNDLGTAAEKCDQEKLSSAAEACGTSLMKNPGKCTSECENLYKTAGDSCAEFFKLLGFEDIVNICKDGNWNTDALQNIGDASSDVASTIADAAGTTTPTTTPSTTTPSSTPASTPSSDAAALTKSFVMILATVAAAILW